MKMKTTFRAAAAASLALMLSACSAGYDRAETIEDLVEEGNGQISEAQAVCIVDRLEVEIGVDRLGSRGEPTAAEEQIITSAAVDCVLGS